MIVTSDLLNQDNFNSWINIEKQDVDSSYIIGEFNKLSDEYKMNTCVDLGSNIGLFSLKASIIYENVFSFEASYLSCLASKNFLINRNNRDNIWIYNLAVSDKSGKIVKLKSQMDVDGKYFSGNNSITIEDNEMPFEYCMSICLEDIYKLLNITYIDYLKVDIEGSEYDLLMNKNLSNIGIIACELHGNTQEEYLLNKDILIKYLSKYFELSMLDNIVMGVNKKINHSKYFFQELKDKTRKLGMTVYTKIDSDIG